MANVYVIVSSNCEDYEDYHASIDSVWSSRAAAIAHIEGTLGMKQVDKFDPARRWSRDRWMKDFPELPEREDFESEEDWADAHDENGELIPYWVYHRDAWIEEYQLDPKQD